MDARGGAAGPVPVPLRSAVAAPDGHAFHSRTLDPLPWTGPAS